MNHLKECCKKCEVHVPGGYLCKKDTCPCHQAPDKEQANFMQVGNYHCFGCHKTFPPEINHNPYVDCKGEIKQCNWNGKECYPDKENNWREEFEAKFGKKYYWTFEDGNAEPLFEFISSLLSTQREDILEKVRLMQKEDCAECNVKDGRKHSPRCVYLSDLEAYLEKK